MPGTAQDVTRGPMAESVVCVDIVGMPPHEHDPLIHAVTPHIPGGVVVSLAVVTDAADDALVDASTQLHPAEAALARALPVTRRPTFVAGRLALRAAITAATPQLAHEPLLRTPRGGPLLPAGVSGSISHKRTRAVAIAAPRLVSDSASRHVGIDIEQRPTDDALRASTHRSLADRILTARERDAIVHTSAFAHRDATLLRFAIKEAVYKAIDPVVQRYVRFTEVELDVSHEGVDTGVAGVHLLLPERPPLRVVATWQRDQHWIIAAAMSEPVDL